MCSVCKYLLKITSWIVIVCFISTSTLISTPTNSYAVVQKTVDEDSKELIEEIATQIKEVEKGRDLPYAHIKRTIPKKLAEDRKEVVHLREIEASSLGMQRLLDAFPQETAPLNALPDHLKNILIYTEKRIGLGDKISTIGGSFITHNLRLTPGAVAKVSRSEYSTIDEVVSALSDTNIPTNLFGYNDLLENFGNIVLPYQSIVVTGTPAKGFRIVLLQLKAEIPGFYDWTEHSEWYEDTSIKFVKALDAALRKLIREKRDISDVEFFMLRHDKIGIIENEPKIIDLSLSGANHALKTVPELSRIENEEKKEEYEKALFKLLDTVKKVRTLPSGFFMDDKYDWEKELIEAASLGEEVKFADIVDRLPFWTLPSLIVGYSILLFITSNIVDIRSLSYFFAVPYVVLGSIMAVKSYIDIRDRAKAKTHHEELIADRKKEFDRKTAKAWEALNVFTKEVPDVEGSDHDSIRSKLIDQWIERHKGLMVISEGLMEAIKDIEYEKPVDLSLEEWLSILTDYVKGIRKLIELNRNERESWINYDEWIKEDMSFYLLMYSESEKQDIIDLRGYFTTIEPRLTHRLNRTQKMIDEALSDHFRETKGESLGEEIDTESLESWIDIWNEVYDKKLTVEVEDRIDGSFVIILTDEDGGWVSRIIYSIQEDHILVADQGTSGKGYRQMRLMPLLHMFLITAYPDIKSFKYRDLTTPGWEFLKRMNKLGILKLQTLSLVLNSRKFFRSAVINHKQVQAIISDPEKLRAFISKQEVTAKSLGVEQDYAEKLESYVRLPWNELPEETRDILNQYGVTNDFIEIAKASGENAALLFQDGLPGVKEIFTPRELKKYWPDLVEMAIASGEDAHLLFERGLPTVKEIFTSREFKKYWPDLVEIAKASGSEAWDIFEFGLFFIRQLIHSRKDLRTFGSDLVEMADASGENAQRLFAEGFPAVKRPFTPEEFKEYWPDLVEIAKASGENAALLFQDGLPAVKELIQSKEDLQAIGNDLVDLANSSGKNAIWLFKNGLPAVKELIRSREDLKSIGSDLVEITEECGDKAALLFQGGFSAIKELFTPEKFKEYWSDLVKIAKASGENAYTLFQDGLPAVKKLIQSKEDLQTIGNDLVALAKTSGENARNLFENGLPAVKELIQSKEDLQAIGNDLVDLAKTSGKNAIWLFKYGLPAVKELIRSREDLKSIGNELAEMADASGEGARELFRDGLYVVKELIRSREDWNFWKSRLIRLNQLTNDYNRERIFKLLFRESDIFRKALIHGGGIKSHFDFYLEILETHPRLSVQILEGLFEAFDTGLITYKLTDRLTSFIHSFIQLTHGFSPALYAFYLEEREKGIAEIKAFSEKAIKDELGPREIMSYLEELNNQGYRGKELVLAGLQMAIPASGASFVTRGEVMGLFEKYLEAGDRRPDIPETLRGPPDNLIDDALVHDANFIRIEYILKENESLDPDSNVGHLLSLLQYPDSGKPEDQAEKETETDRVAFIETLTVYLKEKTPGSKKTAQDAFYTWVSHNDLLKEKIDRIQALDYQSLDLLEQLFLDKDNLSVLFREVINNDIDPELLIAEGKAPIRNLEGLTKQINGIWRSPKFTEETRLLTLGNILKIYDKEEIVQKLIPQLKAEDKLTQTLINLTEGELKARVSLRSLIEDFFSSSIQTIRREKSKYKEIILGEGVEIEFRIVKGVPYGLWGLCAGVCIATDLELWKKQEFFLLSMIDKNKKQAVGFIHFFEAEVDGKKILVVPGIEPSTEFLGEVKARDLYPELIHSIQETAKKGNYEQIFLPTDSNILSNRSDIAKLIEKQNFTKLSLDQPIAWNTLPKPYRISEVYILPLEPISGKSLGEEAQQKRRVESWELERIVNRMQIHYKDDVEHQLDWLWDKYGIENMEIPNTLVAQLGAYMERIRQEEILVPSDFRWAVAYLGCGIVNEFLFESFRKANIHLGLDDEKFLWRVWHARIKKSRSIADIDPSGILADSIERQLAKKKPNEKLIILEVGSGPDARALKELKVHMDKKKQSDSIEYHAFDLVAEEKYEDEIFLHPGDVRDMAFEDKTFDLGFSHKVLLYYDFKDDVFEKAINEILRVLKPGGQFIILYPNTFLVEHGEVIEKKLQQMGVKFDFKSGSFFLHKPLDADITARSLGDEAFDARLQVPDASFQEKIDTGIRQPVPGAQITGASLGEIEDIDTTEAWATEAFIADEEMRKTEMDIWQLIREEVAFLVKEKGKDGEDVDVYEIGGSEIGAQEVLGMLEGEENISYTVVNPSDKSQPDNPVWKQAHYVKEDLLKIDPDELDVKPRFLIVIRTLEYIDFEKAIAKLKEISSDDAEIIFVINLSESPLMQRVRDRLQGWKAYILAVERAIDYLEDKIELNDMVTLMESDISGINNNDIKQKSRERIEHLFSRIAEVKKAGKESIDSSINKFRKAIRHLEKRHKTIEGRYRPIAIDPKGPMQNLSLLQNYLRNEFEVATSFTVQIPYQGPIYHYFHVKKQIEGIEPRVTGASLGEEVPWRVRSEARDLWIHLDDQDQSGGWFADRIQDMWDGKAISPHDAIDMLANDEIAKLSRADREGVLLGYLNSRASSLKGLTGSRIIDFYNGKILDHQGRSIEDLWRSTDDIVESDHDAIQLLFPTEEASPILEFSRMLTSRPGVSGVLDEKSISLFRSRKSLRNRMLKSVDLMLRFYGLEYGFQENKVIIKRAENFKERASVWLTKDNHNFYRITRMIQSLRLVGLEKYAVIFFNALTSIYDEFREVIDYSGSYEFWSSAVEGLSLSEPLTLEEFNKDRFRKISAKELPSTDTEGKSLGEELTFKNIKDLTKKEKSSFLRLIAEREAFSINKARAHFKFLIGKETAEIVAFHNETAVGWASLAFTKESSRTGKIGLIELYVKEGKKYRKQGYGRRLVRKTEDYFMEKGIKQYSFEVDHRDEAQVFWEKILEENKDKYTAKRYENFYPEKIPIEKVEKIIVDLTKGASLGEEYGDFIPIAQYIKLKKYYPTGDNYPWEARYVGNILSNIIENNEGSFLIGGKELEKMKKTVAALGVFQHIITLDGIPILTYPVGGALTWRQPDYNKYTFVDEEVIQGISQDKNRLLLKIDGQFHEIHKAESLRGITEAQVKADLKNVEDHPVAFSWKEWQEFDSVDPNQDIQDEIITLLNEKNIKAVITNVPSGTVLPEYFKNNRVITLKGDLTGDSLKTHQGFIGEAKVVYLSDLLTSTESITNTFTDTQKKNFIAIQPKHKKGIVLAAVLFASGNPRYQNAFDPTNSGFWEPTIMGASLGKIAQDILSQHILAKAA